MFFVFFCFFGAKIWPAAADTGELGWDLRDPTPQYGETFGGMQPQYLGSPGPTQTRPPGQK